MAAWMLVLQKQHNRSWLKEYVANIPPIMKKYGGRYMAVSPSISSVETALTEPHVPAPNLVAIFSFSSKENLEQFLKCEEYRPYSELRMKNSFSDIMILDDVQTEFPWA